MAINLEKGQRIELGLKNVCVGLGWDPNPHGGEDFDLDASAFLLGANHKLPADDYLVFYNNLSSPDGAVTSSGDDRTGGNSEEGDDEVITVNLDRLNPAVKEIIFTATIHKAAERRQNFGQVRNAYIRIFNADTGDEIARYDLEEDFSVETGLEFGRLYLKNDVWKFEAMGVGHKGGLQYFVDTYA